MAENRIVTLSKNNLVINADTEEYIFRYRIVSEDRNRLSAWSPAYRLLAPTINQILFNNGLIDSNGQRLFDDPVYNTSTVGTTIVANVFWNAPSIFNERQIYDLYIKWGNFDSGTGTVVYDGDYEYIKGVSALSFSFPKPSSKASYDRISIVVQSQTYPKKVVTNQIIYSIVDKVF